MLYDDDDIDFDDFEFDEENFLHPRVSKKSRSRVLEVKARSVERVELWVLRALVLLRGNYVFLGGDGGIECPNVAEFLGIESYFDEISRHKTHVKNLLNQRLETLEANPPTQCPKTFKRNIRRITKHLGLNQTERDILVFLLHLEVYEIMQCAMRMMGQMSTNQIIRALAVLTHHKPTKVKKALEPQSILLASKLISLDRTGRGDMNFKINILSSDFADRVMTLDSPIEKIIQNSVRQCRKSELGVEDFDYLQSDLTLLITYLKGAMQRKQKGVNILFYGKPGTGKTELTKAIAEAVGTALYEVNYIDKDGDPIPGMQRLNAYQVAQSFFRGGDLILMFDEIEDVIGSNRISSLFGFGQKKKQDNKGWMNRMLENNAIPTVWITNDIDDMDPALTRRYDMVLEIPVPPRSKREALIRKEADGVLDANAIRAIASHTSIAPALVTRAARVTHVVEKPKERKAAFVSLLNHTLKAQGEPLLTIAGTGALPEHYDPSYVHAQINLKELANSLNTSPRANLCLYGAPGTGKSAFGKWIAQQINKPLLLKKGSDIISKWVGDTEKNIAAAFEEARKEQSVLVFDEVEGLLQDRKGARNSWEVTQVNEMLVQMENFDGIFIATTNHLKELDQASLRRFDMKLEFGFLQPDQAWQLFVQECHALGIKRTSAKKMRHRVHKQSHLTPGDFATVRRQHRLRPIKTAEDFYRRLAAECALKHNEGVKMGFL